MRVVGSGFLSREGLHVAEKVEQDLQGVLTLLSRAIDLCHEGLAAIVVPSHQSLEAKQRVIACVVMARVLEISEAIVVLARGGFSVEVTSATRTFLEAYFIFANVCEDAGFVSKYFSTDLKTRQTLINQAAKHRGPPFDSINAFATPDKREGLKKWMEELEVEGLDTYKNANNVGCAVIYDSLYRVTSAATHSSPRALGGYVLEDPDGNVLEVRRYPQLGDIGSRVHDVGCFLLIVRDAFDVLFGNVPSQAMASLRKEFEVVAIPDIS